AMAAVSSMRLFVVWASPPPSSVTCPSGVTTMAPQPPGPGLPLAAPSLKTRMPFSFIRAFICARDRDTGARGRERRARRPARVVPCSPRRREGYRRRRRPGAGTQPEWRATGELATCLHPPSDSSSGRARPGTGVGLAPPGGNVMPEDEQAVANLVRDALRDVQDLVRAEIALARAEVREEGRRLTMAIVLLGVAAVAALVAVGLLGAAAAWGVAALFVWPPWAGYALVGAVVLL